MKGIYVLAFIMFFGLIITMYSSYRMTNIIEERNLAIPGGVQSKRPETPPIMITDPDLQPYLLGSVFGMALFFVGAIGGVIAIVKAYTRRF